MSAVQSLIAQLQELSELVANQHFQPLHQIAEAAVMHWLCVVEGKESVQPRYSPARATTEDFCQGLEPEPTQQIDPVVHPTEQPEVFTEDLKYRIAELIADVQACLDPDGYRPSAEQCDRTMLTVERMSRFLAAARAQTMRTDHATEHSVEGSAEPAAETREDDSATEDEGDPDWYYFLWEPYLNAAAVSWQENSLRPFEEALSDLAHLSDQSPKERGQHFLGAGYPLRQPGRPRTKVQIFSPTLRPLRTRSVFEARLGQLYTRIDQAGEDKLTQAGLLLDDVRHITQMLRENAYLLASNPGFLDQARHGLPTIRGWPNAHPFLMDPMEFFKKAVLFANGTYTVAGGGIDEMYLRLRQLERYYRFHKGQETRQLLTQIQDCAVAWEENSLPRFTTGLVKLATILRSLAAPPHSGPVDRSSGLV